MDLKEEQKKMLEKYRLFLGLLLIFILIIILITKTLILDLMGALTPIIVLPLYVIAIIFSIFIFAIIVFRMIRNLLKKNTANLTINILILILSFTIVFVPTATIYEKSRFKMYKSSFDSATKELLKYDSTGNVALPEKYWYISRGQEAYVENSQEYKMIFFYINRGLLDNFSVYAYAPTSKDYEALKNHTNWKKLEEVSEGWYFGLST